MKKDAREECYYYALKTDFFRGYYYYLKKSVSYPTFLGLPVIPVFAKEEAKGSKRNIYDLVVNY